MGLEVGLEATLERTVSAPQTARSVRSGDIDVLATPVVVAFCEFAAVQALEGALPDGETTVGVQIDLQHLAPTVPGRPVHYHARLDAIEGRKLVFHVDARDDIGEIAHGRHIRMRVDRERFLKLANERS